MVEAMKAMRYLAMAIAASRRLGWIALGLYIHRVNMSATKTMLYDKLIDYHRAMNNDYHFVETSMKWADDYRMVMFGELAKRLDAIDDNWGTRFFKENQKSILIRRATNARAEIEGAWLN